MNKEKMIYTEKGEGKSATETTRKECKVCGSKKHSTLAHGAKSKALEAKKEEKGEKKGFKKREAREEE